MCKTISLLAAMTLTIVAADTPAGKLSELEQEKFKRMSLQLNALRFQYEANAQPVVQEQQALIEKVCSAAKIPVADCVINADAGTVTKREAEQQTAGGAANVPTGKSSKSEKQ
jgi:hypothetical protein